MTTVWIYVDTGKQVGDVDHLKVFGNADAADEWFKVNDPEGVVFGYPVIGDFDEPGGPLHSAGSADRQGVPRATEERPPLRLVPKHEKPAR